MEPTIQSIRAKVLSHIDKKLDKGVSVRDLREIASTIVTLSSDSSEWIQKLMEKYYNPETTSKPTKGGK